MKYTVRSKDGELEYASFAQVEDAARLGFVEPDDELRREGETEWKKASAYPKLLNAKPTRQAWWSSSLFRWIALSLGGAGFAFWAIHRGNTEDRPDLYAAGITAAFLVVGVLFKVTADASRRR